MTRTMENCFVFPSKQELSRFPVGSVVCVIAGGNYSTVVTVDGVEHLLLLQLGQVEQRIKPFIERGDQFALIGKSLLINCDFLSYIDVSRQKLILSDCRTFSRELSASKKALTDLKGKVEKKEGVEQKEDVEQKESQ